MRNLRQFMLLIMTVSLVTLTSCSNDDGGDGPSTAGSGVLVAKIDGTSFQSMAISSSATLANNGQNLIIIASNSDGKAFSMSIFGYAGENQNYPIGGGANIFNIGSYTETDVDLNNPQNSTTEIWQAPYDDTMVGEIFIESETDDKVIGTFSFSCKNTGGDQSVKTITEGSFNLTKQVVD